ncbi:Uncharacterized protein APZ42_015216 [Daphnia magna]|uniref:Uncharacterized protein n=1 Tax=Daphnia magna TaxID=35525 RepID=A0A162P966_9CRUS|nr:Uncharacterized protein APZ42_015216 [Daphnia magna]
MPLSKLSTFGGMVSLSHFAHTRICIAGSERTASFPISQKQFFLSHNSNEEFTTRKTVEPTI